MKKPFLTGLFVISQLIVIGQIGILDSLQGLLTKHPQQDTMRINLLNKIAQEYYYSEPEQTLKYANESGELADKLSFTAGKSESLRMVGLYYQLEGDYPRALELFQNSLQIAEKAGRKLLIAKCLLNVGYATEILGKYDQAFEYFEKSLKICLELSEQKEIAKCYIHIGAIYRARLDYSNANEFFRKALAINEKLGEKREIARTNMNIGTVYRVQGYYTQALEYFQISGRQYDELGDKQGIGMCLLYMGLIHTSLLNYPLATEYYQKSIKIAEPIGDKQIVSAAFRGLAESYLSEGKLQQAMENYRIFLKMAQEIGYRKGTSWGYNDIGKVLAKQGQNNEALENFQKSLQIAKEINVKDLICENYLNIGSVYLKQKDLALALEYTQKGLAVAEELQFLDRRARIYLQLSQIYELNKDYKQSLQFYKSYKMLNDSVFNEKNISRLNSLEYTYKYEKEKQLLMSEQKNKELVNAEAAKHQKRLMLFLILGSFMMFILVMVVLKSNIRNRKINRLLVQQKGELQAANSEIQQKQKELTENMSKLESSNKELETFSYSVSHDLRAPLRSLAGFSNLLERKYGELLDEQGKDYLNRILRASERMSELIDDLLTFSRLNRVEIRRQKIDLSSLAESVVEELIIADPSRKVKFTIQKEMYENADRNLILIVLQNILGNAWKYSRNTSEAIIEFGKLINDGNPVYFIRDNGAGFDMKYADKLFGPFQRLHSPSEFEGTGIGLATSQRIIFRHGGKIWAEGIVDNGATFYFTIA